MSTETSVQNAASEPATFDEYLSLKSAASPVQTQEEEKAAPASEPEEVKEESAKEEDKTSRKARNDQRRERRWYEERGAMREQMRQLQEQVERLKSGPKEQATDNGKPTLKTFLDSGKYDTYEGAHEAYLDARDEWNRKQWDSEQHSKEVERTEKEVATTFQKSIATFAKQYEDFDEAFEFVKDHLDNSALHLSDAIVRSEKPGELITYLAAHEDELERLLDLSPQRGIMALGKIIASLEPKKAKAETPLETPVKQPIKAPKLVRGGSSLPTRDEALRSSAEANDFASFQAANRRKG